MEGERTCPRCGAALGEEVRFCTSCGERIAPAAAFAAKRSMAPLLVGAAGGLLLVAGAALLVVYLTLWRGGAGSGGDPVSLAREYMESLEKEDVDAYLACFEEDFLEDDPFLIDLGLEPREMLVMAFGFMDISFEGVELELGEEKGEKTTVVTTAGTLSMSVLGMEEQVDLADEPLEFKMFRKGGRWYLAENPLPATGTMDMDFDKEDTYIDPDGYDLEDLEEYLPEGWDLEDLEDLGPGDLEELIRELMEELDEPPQPKENGGETLTRASCGIADRALGRRG